MAQIKNYGLIGVGNNVQLGKNGPKLEGNAESGTFVVTNEGGALTTIKGANATQSSDLVTKAQLDAVSVTLFKANMAAVYADSNINTGDLLVVTDAGDGEYGVYISNQDAPTQLSHLTAIASRDSAVSDAGSLTSDVDYTSGTVTLGDVSAGSKIEEVMITVNTVYDDANASLSVGDDSDNNRLFEDAYLDLTATGTYVVNPSYVYTGTLDSDNTIKVYQNAGTSTQGNVTVSVTYS